MDIGFIRAINAVARYRKLIVFPDAD